MKAEKISFDRTKARGTQNRKVQPLTDETRLAVRVQPGAKRDEVCGWVGEGTSAVLRVRLRAPAIEGKANQGLIEFLAQTYELRPRQITLLLGEHSRDKVVRLEGITWDKIRSVSI